MRSGIVGRAILPADALSARPSRLKSRPTAKVGRPTRPAAGSYIRSIRHRRWLRSSVTPLPLNHIEASFDNPFRANCARLRWQGCRRGSRERLRHKTGHTSVQTGSAGGLAKARPPKRLHRFSSLIVGRRPMSTGVDARPTGGAGYRMNRVALRAACRSSASSISRSSSAENESPLCSHIFGYMLMEVKPGMVLISFR